MAEVIAAADNVIERYLRCLSANDWDGLATTMVDKGLVRDGPFCDIVEGKQPYIAFLRDVFSRLPGYRLTVQRISHVSERLCYVELTETFEINAVPTAYPECIRFERNNAGLISRVSVYMKRPGDVPGVEGGRAL
ncbi:nuclear transport factor 2 family protein [Mycobacterium botniense]|uniref:SnoaL-like domain-containing protein n=1 Tax=Mycobacterium botniense TaxID=84962 RepID=A0A7I9XVL7_9MYCO|nr:nuclear transport factor 2 family protein [Mycobacterium botniense]GFG73829.1 hypothetical protein MBOT_11940 [Mycobacterium botniense]